jgi:hypothetical protein
MNNYQKYLKYKKKYIELKNKIGGGDTLKEDGTKVGKLIVGNGYALVANPGRMYSFTTDYNSISPWIAPGRDVEFYVKQDGDNTFYGVADGNGVTEYAEERDIIIPGTNYKYKDDSVITIEKLYEDEADVLKPDGSKIKILISDIYRLDTKFSSSGASAPAPSPPLGVKEPVIKPLSFKIGGQYVTSPNFTLYRSSSNDRIVREYKGSFNVTIIENKHGDTFDNGRCLCRFRDTITEKVGWIKLSDIIFPINEPINIKKKSEIFRTTDKTGFLGSFDSPVIIINNERPPFSSLVNNMVLVNYKDKKIGWTDVSNIL